MKLKRFLEKLPELKPGEAILVQFEGGDIEVIGQRNINGGLCHCCATFGKYYDKVINYWIIDLTKEELK